MNLATYNLATYDKPLLKRGNFDYVDACSMLIVVSRHSNGNDNHNYDRTDANKPFFCMHCDVFVIGFDDFISLMKLHQAPE